LKTDIAVLYQWLLFKVADTDLSGRVQVNLSLKLVVDEQC